MIAMYYVLFGLAVFNHELDVKGQQTAINRIFITLTDGVSHKTYSLTLKDSAGSTKDQISITPDKPTLNLNYSPPPGVTININDQICVITCIPIPLPDSFGTSSITLNLATSNP